MASAEDENLKVFYRTMTTEQLLTYRAALAADVGGIDIRHVRHVTVAFATHRRRLVAEVLQERGVEALN